MQLGSVQIIEHARSAEHDTARPGLLQNGLPARQANPVRAVQAP
jgi:hypothetical protein